MVLAYIIRSDGETGKHTGFKLLRAVMLLRVRFPLGLLIKIILIFMFNPYKSQKANSIIFINNYNNSRQAS